MTPASEARRLAEVVRSGRASGHVAVYMLARDIDALLALLDAVGASTEAWTAWGEAHDVTINLPGKMWPKREQAARYGVGGVCRVLLMPAGEAEEVMPRGDEDGSGYGAVESGECGVPVSVKPDRSAISSNPGEAAPDSPSMEEDAKRLDELEAPSADTVGAEILAIARRMQRRAEEASTERWVLRGLLSDAVNYDIGEAVAAAIRKEPRP